MKNDERSKKWEMYYFGTFRCTERIKITCDGGPNTNKLIFFKRGNFRRHNCESYEDVCEYSKTCHMWTLYTDKCLRLKRKLRMRLQYIGVHESIHKILFKYTFYCPTGNQ